MGWQGVFSLIPVIPPDYLASFSGRVYNAEKMLCCQFSSFPQTPGSLAFIPGQ